MRQWLEIQFSDRIESHAVRADAGSPTLGIVDCACPGCAAFPLVIRASAPRDATDRADTIEGNGHAACCGDPVGYVYAQRETLFGDEEDREVLIFSRARVYGKPVPRV